MKYAWEKSRPWASYLLSYECWCDHLPKESQRIFLTSHRKIFIRKLYTIQGYNVPLKMTLKRKSLLRLLSRSKARERLVPSNLPNLLLSLKRPLLRNQLRRGLWNKLERKKLGLRRLSRKWPRRHLLKRRSSKKFRKNQPLEKPRSKSAKQHRTAFFRDKNLKSI